MNTNANLSYMWKTFDHANCGAMYTNQAMEMTQTLEDTNKPRTPLQMSVFIWAQALYALDGKRKAILHMPKDVAKYSQWDLTYQEPQFCNKEWLGRVLLSWINIRGQTVLVNTALDIYRNALDGGIHQAPNTKERFCHAGLLTWSEIKNHFVPVKLQSLLYRAENKPPLF